MDVYCPPIRSADWHEVEPGVDRRVDRPEKDVEWKLPLMDQHVEEGHTFLGVEGPLDVRVLKAETRRQRSKVRRLLLSCILSSSLCLISLGFGLGDAAGLFTVIHPMFWFPIAAGSFGVSGSNFIYLRHLWPI